MTRNRRRSPNDFRDMGSTCSWAREAASARLDHELDEPESTVLDEHMATCAECRRYVSDATALHRAIRVRPSEPMPDLTDDIMGRLRAPRSGRRRNAVLVTAATAVAVVGALVALAARGSDTPPELGTIDAIAGPASADANLSAYLTIVNDGGSDSLTSASSPAAERVVLHTTEIDDGLTTMRRRAGYVVEGDATTIFRPGRAHLMFEDVRDDLDVGDEVELTLRFAQSGARTVTVRVVPMTEVIERLEPTTTD